MHARDGLRRNTGGPRDVVDRCHRPPLSPADIDVMTPVSLRCASDSVQRNFRLTSAIAQRQPLLVLARHRVEQRARRRAFAGRTAWTSSTRRSIRFCRAKQRQQEPGRAEDRVAARLPNGTCVKPSTVGYLSASSAEAITSRRRVAGRKVACVRDERESGRSPARPTGTATGVRQSEAPARRGCSPPRRPRRGSRGANRR